MEASDLSAPHLRLQARARMPTPDRARIYDWCRRHVKLVGNFATGGAFNVHTSPWLISVFDALQDESVRVVSFSKSIQIGGTLVADMWIPWIIANDPGAITLTMHVDDMMMQHAKTRLNPILENCRPVSILLPKPGPHRTITEIYFGGFSLILNTATISDQQSQSVRYKINDELWHSKWQSVYADAVGRVSKYEEVGTSKILNISQGGVDGDVADRVWREGHMGEWSAECPACGKVYPLAFCVKAGPEAEAKQLGGVVWDRAAKGEDDIWDVGRAVETTRHRCPHCAHESPDTDQTREKWKRSGRYVGTNPKAPAKTRSFHVESLASRPMVLLTEEWLNACNEATRTGNEEPMMKFRQKREAKSWKVERTAVNIINVSASTYCLADYADGTKRVPGEHLRAMTLDRQQTHWWCEVGAWTLEPQYYQLFFGRIDTIDAVRALQKRYQVADSCVVQDRAYQPSKTDEDSVRFGWRGMMGASQGRKTWTMLNETTGEMAVYPHSDPKYAVVGGGMEAPFYEVSHDHSKDLLFNALNGKGIKWNLPRDVSAIYLEHLKSEAKVEVRPGVWRYVEQVQNKNHGLDCSAMMMMLAIIAGIVRFKLTEEK